MRVPIPAFRRRSRGGQKGYLELRPLKSSSHMHYAWAVLAMGTLVVFGSLGLARFGYSVILPAMQRDLAMDNTQAGALATANLVGYVTLSVVGGALATRYGPRRVITLGMLLAGTAMLLTGVAQRFGGLALWRLLTGLGSGASNVPVLGLMGAWFVSRRRGFASGVVVAGSSLGLIVVGALVPAILSTYGPGAWRTCWFLFGGMTLALALLGYLLLRDHPADVGLQPLGQTGGSLSERSAQRVRWAKVYRSRPVWHLGLVYVAFGFSYIIYMTFFSKRLIECGYSPEAAGRLFMLMGWASILCGLIWGTLSDLIGRQRALLIVYLTHAMAFGLFALWPTPLGFTLAAVLYGLTAWSIPAIMAAACADVIGPHLAPAALGFITLFFGIGQAAGPAVGGAMADASGSFFGAYLLAAGVALLGALGAWCLRLATTRL